MKQLFSYPELEARLEQIRKASTDHDWEVATSLYTELLESFVTRVALNEDAEWFIQEQGEAILNTKPERSY